MYKYMYSCMLYVYIFILHISKYVNTYISIYLYYILPNFSLKGREKKKKKGKEMLKIQTIHLPSK